MGVMPNTLPGDVGGPCNLNLTFLCGAGQTDNLLSEAPGTLGTVGVVVLPVTEGIFYALLILPSSAYSRHRMERHR
jgi:hypothetical protein